MNHNKIKNSMKIFNKDKIDKMYKYYEKNRKKSKYIPFLKKKINKNNSIFIIVPYRKDRDVDFFNNKKKKREIQLKYFIDYFKKILKGYNYYIYIIEQHTDGQKFNRGMLLNIGVYLFSDICKDDDIIILHNINLYPEKDILPYYFEKPKYPNSIIQAINVKFNDNLDGILSMTYKDFKKINGFPNTFFGKGGGENIAIYNRITKEIGKIMGPKNGTIKFWNENNINNINKINNEYIIQKNFIQKEQILLDLINWKNNGFSNIYFNVYDIIDYGDSKIKLLNDQNISDIEKIYKQDYNFVNNFEKKKIIKNTKNIIEYRYHIIKSDKYKIIFFYNKDAGAGTLKTFIYETEKEKKVREFWHIEKIFEDNMQDKIIKYIDEINNDKYKDYKKVLIFKNPIDRFKTFYINKLYNRNLKKKLIKIIDYLINTNPLNYEPGLQLQTSSIKREWLDELVFYKDLEKYLVNLRKDKVRIIHKLPKTNIVNFKVSIYEKITINYNLLRNNTKNIYLVNGLRRSGNHLFLGYLISGLKKKVYFLNNISIYSLNLGKIKDYRTSEANLFSAKISLNIKNLNKIFYDDNFDLVLSIEDKNIKRMNMFYDILKTDKNNIYKIIVIRDIYNTFSSRLKKDDWNKMVDEVTIEYWKDLYNCTKKNDYIIFNYNKFICNKKNYREKLNKKLNLKNPIISISKASGGSSFLEGTLIKQDLESYFTRFINFKKNKLIKKLLNDKEMLKITKKDFKLDINNDNIKIC